MMTNTFEDRIMKKCIIAVLIALLPAAAVAQNKGPPTVRSDYEKKQDADIDKQYRDARKRVIGAPSQAASADPWQTVRPAPTDTTTKH